MNDTRDPRTRLLADTLHDDWTGGLSAAKAQRAAAHARRRRTLRRASLTLATAAAIGTTILLNHRAPRHLVPSPASPTPSVAHAGYEIISDDELVALLHDRPLLVLP